MGGRIFDRQSDAVLGQMDGIPDRVRPKTVQAGIQDGLRAARTPLRRKRLTVVGQTERYARPLAAEALDHAGQRVESGTAIVRPGCDREGLHVAVRKAELSRPEHRAERLHPGLDRPAPNGPTLPRSDLRDAGPRTLDRIGWLSPYSWVELADWIPSVLAGVSDPRCIKRGICAAGAPKASYPTPLGLIAIALASRSITLTFPNVDITSPARQIRRLASRASARKALKSVTTAQPPNAPAAPPRGDRDRNV